MRLAIEIDREADGRFIADVPDLPGVLAYGATREQAISRAMGLALHVLADRVEHGEISRELFGDGIAFEAA